MNNIKHIETPVGYQKTSIGLIPKEWEVKEILDVGVIKGGYAFKSREFKDEGKFQVVKMSNIYKGTLDLNRSSSFLTELDEREKEYFLEKGDILISLTGTVGKQDYGYTYLIEEEENLLLNQRLAKISSKGDLIYQYLFYSLKTQQFLKQFFNSSHGGTGNQANVGVVDLGRIDIPIPPLPEQKAIADCLTTWDKGIEQLSALIESKKEQKKGLMQQLLTGEKRLDGFTEEWEYKKISEVAQVIGGGTPSTTNDEYWNGEINWFTPTEIKNKFVSESLRTITKKGLKKSSAKLLPPGTILLTTRATIGEASIAKNECSTNQGFQSIVCIDGKANVFFFYDLIRYNKKEFLRRANGSTFLEISKKEIDKIEFYIPSYKEQTAIAEVLSTADKEIELFEKKLDQFKTQKKGLMQVLLTGQKRLIN